MYCERLKCLSLVFRNTFVLSLPTFLSKHSGKLPNKWPNKWFFWPLGEQLVNTTLTYVDVLNSFSFEHRAGTEQHYHLSLRCVSSFSLWWAVCSGLSAHSEKGPQSVSTKSFSSFPWLCQLILVPSISVSYSLSRSFVSFCVSHWSFLMNEKTFVLHCLP